MKKNVLLSVIIPCFNNEDFVYECLESIPCTDEIEIIVVNDGSTDNSESEINRFMLFHKNKNLNFLLINQSNQGVSVARNTGVRCSSGEYIAFLDADDLWAGTLWSTIEPVLSYRKPEMVIFNALKFYNHDVNDISLLEVTK